MDGGVPAVGTAIKGVACRRQLSLKCLGKWASISIRDRCRAQAAKRHHTRTILSHVAQAVLEPLRGGRDERPPESVTSRNTDGKLGALALYRERAQQLRPGYDVTHTAQQDAMSSL